MSKAVIAYVPVLHEGYRRFFEKHSDADEVFIFGKGSIGEFDWLAKEIRALSPELVKSALESWGFTKKVSILEPSEAPKVFSGFDSVLMPDEDVCRTFAEKYANGKEISFDKVFLRWDRHNSSIGKSLPIDQKISIEAFDRDVIRDLESQAERSSDWWRGVAAAVVKDGKLLFSARNEHMPSPHTPYANGDPRNNFHKGVHIELSSSMHAEAAVVAWAAKNGVSLEGVSLYVSVFPCPPCAKLVANSGVKKLYYSGGYGMLDGDDILKGKGIEVVFVDMGK